MKRLAAISIMALTVTGSVSAGSIYKCTDATGNVTFSQTACPVKTSGDQIGYSEPSPSQSRSSSRQSAPRNSSRYTIMNQAKQADVDKDKRDHRYRQKELDREIRHNRNRGKELERRSDKERCERYKMNARSDYLSGERKSYYRKLAAEYCR